MSWVRLEVFQPGDADAQSERAKFENVAEDMALIPERNVQLVDLGDGKLALEISEEMDACMKGI
ncbi:MAG: hypothetical protein PWQ57_393 [Desulfovibrionales bacterium]|jgi:hypothetical protein|nr:hypothetical protein [Desulfovibrionales bacterium]